MDIEVALAFATFQNAPKEVIETANKFSENFIALKKASAQADIWNKEKRSAQENHDALLKDFKAAIDRWDPAGLNELTAVESANLVSGVVTR